MRIMIKSGRRATKRSMEMTKTMQSHFLLAHLNDRIAFRDDGEANTRRIKTIIFHIIDSHAMTFVAYGN